MAACSDDPRIYKAWPEETVMAELRVFKDAMYNGAGPDELSAGLLAIDFLTRGSVLSDTARMLVDAAIDEADMRISLMRKKEAEDMDASERRRQLVQALRGMELGLTRVTAIIESAKCRFETVSELQAFIEKYAAHQEPNAHE